MKGGENMASGMSKEEFRERMLQDQARRRQPEPTFIWEKQPGESPRAFAMFQIYRDMGPSRTHAQVVQRLGRKPGYKGQLQEWSAKYDWVARCEAYDIHMDKLRLQAMEEEIQAMVKRQTHNAMLMQEKALEYLRTRGFPKATLRDVVALMIEGAKLERLNRGEPTENTATKSKVEVSGEVKTTNVNRKEKITRIIADPEAKEALISLYRKAQEGTD